MFPRRVLKRYIHGLSETPGKLTGIRIWKQSQNKRSSHNLARWVAGISVKIMAGLFF